MNGGKQERAHNSPNRRIESGFHAGGAENCRLVGIELFVGLHHLIGWRLLENSIHWDDMGYV